MHAVRDAEFQLDKWAHLADLRYGPADSFFPHGLTNPGGAAYHFDRAVVMGRRTPFPALNPVGRIVRGRDLVQWA